MSHDIQNKLSSKYFLMQWKAIFIVRTHYSSLIGNVANLKYRYYLCLRSIKNVRKANFTFGRITSKTG